MKRWPPPHIETGPDKRNQRSWAGGPRRQMRRPTRRGSNAWGGGRTSAERLGVDAISRDAQRCKADGQVAHERRWSADVEITIVWQVKLLNRLHI